MKLEQVPGPEPGAGQVVVRLEAAGVNFIDINHRSGAYEVPLPFIPGSEGAGVVEEIGAGADESLVGQRFAFVGAAGTYAERTVVGAEQLVPIPEGVSSETAAAVMLQGMTAHCLLESVWRFEPGSRVLVHAAAGGVGLLLTQLATAKGLRVIGTTSSAAKAELARAAGAEHVVVYSERDFVDEVRSVTDGRGVVAVFDAVGRTTFEGSLASLAPHGCLFLYGQASGPPDPIEVMRLAEGSLFLCRPRLVDHIATRDDLLWRAGDVLGAVAEGRLSVRIHERYRLDQAPEAHRAIQERATTGKSLLIP